MSQPASDADRPTSRLDQLIHEYLQQVDEGKSPDRAAMLREHPDLADEMAGFFEDQDRIANFAQRLRLEETVVLAESRAIRIRRLANGAVVVGCRARSDISAATKSCKRSPAAAWESIYKARQSRLDRVVALKMILAGQLASAADVSRFYGEAQAAANLEHPGIVPIYEVGQYGGQHYFSMAFVDGESLASRLAAGPMLQRDAALLVQQLCEAVQYAHQRGVIHRDLKPGNVLIDGDGRPRITDFGLAEANGGGQRSDGHRPGARHAELHAAGTSRGRFGGGWTGGRHLFAGGGVVRGANRPAAVSGRDADRHALASAVTPIPFRRGSSTRRSRKTSKRFA